MVELDPIPCPDAAAPFDRLAAHVDATGCVLCGEVAARRIGAGLATPSDSPSDELAPAPKSEGRFAVWKREEEARVDREREARGLEPPINAGAYARDAIILGDAEIEPPAKAKERDQYSFDAVKKLMEEAPTSSAGGGSSEGRRRRDPATMICGDPCDRGCGMPCEIRPNHDGSHACRECKHASKRGRPTIEEVPRSERVQVRASKPTLDAIAGTKKSMSTILAELATAITEGRPYNPTA